MSPPLWTRVFLTAWLAAGSAAISYYFWTLPQATPSDFAQLWAAAQALLDGRSPYEVVGPGREFEWSFPLLYPMPAVLLAVLLAWLPLRLADPLFVAIGAGALAWALTRERLNNPQLLLFASAAYLFNIQTSQWSPLIMAAALMPSLGPVLACKPPLALAMMCAYPSRRALAGAAVLVVVSLCIFPWWPRDWINALPAARHVAAPVVSSLAGPVLLLAGLKWRRPEARLLLALTCIPHTPGLYEALPLFLVSKSAREAVSLSVLSLIVAIGSLSQGPFQTFDLWMTVSGRWIFWLMYIPSLVMVLRRPNVSQDPPCGPGFAGMK